MTEVFEFENPYRKSIWAKSEEFRGDGKKIKILGFQSLLKDEGNPPAHYVSDQWKGTYRLTFEDDGMKRFYENRYHEFADDLKNSGMKQGQIGVLFNNKKGNKWEWEWTALEENEN